MGNKKGIAIDFKARESIRFKAIELIEEGLNQAQVARQLGVVRQTVSRWVKEKKEGGIDALTESPIHGKKSKMTAEQKIELERIILKGPKASGYAIDLWTAKRIRDVIKKRFGISYHKDHVWKILKQLGFSCQRPAKRALERDEEKIRSWKKKEWPRLKKTP